ncbi:MAG: sigma-70 family RNA polymerase sigma factor [Elusimicrobiota bacterium]
MEQNGPGPQFDKFVEEYGERAFQFSYRLTGNIEDAKDLVQEAFFRVLRSWDRYDASRALDSWFFTILRNVFLDGRKRYERRNVLSLERAVRGEADGEQLTYEDLIPEEDGRVLETLERAEAAETVRRALDSLAYDHRVALTLCDMEGLCYEEISRVLDVPVGTVRSRISRARIALRRVLAAERFAADELS